MSDIKMIFSSNLKRIMSRKGENQADLARALNRTESTVSDWVKGKTMPRSGALQEISDHYRVNLSDLTSEYVDTSKIIPISDFTTIPILGSIPCGYPAEKEPEQIGELMIEKKDVKGGDYFALIAEGDSMLPTIESGEKVVVRKQPVAENGELVAACVDGEITLKRFKVIGDTPFLMPDNPNYQPISLNDSTSTYIIGKITQSIQIKHY